jgi:putative endonuclease
MYKVYAIYNKNHDKIYVGQTKDLETRLELHKEKIFGNSYTSRFDGEWILIYSELVNSRVSALRREKELKSFRGREFIKKHIPR